MSTIRINDLSLRVIIGTHPWERKNKQELILNICIVYDAAKAAKTDHLKDALDYEALVEKVTQLVQRSKCHHCIRLLGNTYNSAA